MMRRESLDAVDAVDARCDEVSSGNKGEGEEDRRQRRRKEILYTKPWRAFRFLRSLCKGSQQQPTAADSAGNRPSGGLGADRGGKAGLQRLAGLLDVGLPSNARALWTVQIYSLEHEASATNGYSKPGSREDRQAVPPYHTA
ncbi:hypothetical protein GTR04_1840 [Trichophyton interdigitale]|nr:hypothetical protein GY631_2547 [Trichophyton interdigitale]KAG5218957.1 hypothetical protein GY632_5037 [Trichophyton interdigitale]KAG8210796.1 hypothetical protein GTR04_1840 [Trichophyton interdigitale]